MSTLFQIDEEFVTNLLVNSTGFTFRFMEKNQSFKECLNDAFQTGFKLQSFLAAKDFRRVSKLLAQSSIEFENLKTNQLDFETYSDNLDQHVYYIRRNVAHGIKVISDSETIESGSNKSICDFYTKNKIDRESICFPFNDAIDNKLNWHQNDLAVEYCETLQPRTIFMPDFHDGPRIDIPS